MGWIRKSVLAGAICAASGVAGAQPISGDLLDGEAGFVELGRAMMRRGDYEKALEAFRLYLDGLPEAERAYYKDISLVASPEVLADYRETPEAERPEFLRRFWMARDPELISGGAWRRVEHYRRVWYARTYFSRGAQPWDRRGEVYIRYGEPDYWSSSREMNFEVPTAVRWVQEALAYEIYGPDAADVSFYGPVFPIRTAKAAELEEFGERSE